MVPLRREAKVDQFDLMDAIGSDSVLVVLEKVDEMVVSYQQQFWSQRTTDVDKDSLFAQKAQVEGAQRLARDLRGFVETKRAGASNPKD